MNWVLIILLWANVQQPLPAIDWGNRAYLRNMIVFPDYASCINAKDKVVASLLSTQRATIACVPIGDK